MKVFGARRDDSCTGLYTNIQDLEYKILKRKYKSMNLPSEKHFIQNRVEFPNKCTARLKLSNLERLLLLIVLPFCLFLNSAAQTVQSNSAASGQDASVEEILLPAPTGQYRVGRASFHRIDTSRPETFTEDSTDKRQVLFHIWYPAESTGGSVAPYIDVLPDNEIFRKSYSFVGIERLVKTRSHTFTGVKVSGAKKQYPVIIFSHGLGAVSALYTTFLENLASHGYIVVGVDSPFFSAALRFADGRIVRNESQRNKRKGAREEEAIVQAQDLIIV